MFAKIFKTDGGSVNKLENAVLLAIKYHNGEYRKGKVNGQSIPYIIHPINVMEAVWVWGAGTEVTLSASVTHDIKENTAIKHEELEFEIGKEAADIVTELTYEGGKEQKKEYMRTFHTSSIDALIIKIADRLDNVKGFMLTQPDYAQKYFDKAVDLFGALMSRLDEIKEKYGEQTSKNIVDSYISVQISLSILETNKER